MAAANTLHDAFLDELRDSYDAEKQLIKALPKLARAATAPALRAAFDAHLKETTGHVARLERVFAGLEEKARGKHCDGIAGIIKEGEAVMTNGFDAATRDACLIAAGQRAEHYEMAAYGTLVAWAREMGHNDAADLLEQILDEEKGADFTLSALAKGGINTTAAGAAHAYGELPGDRASTAAAATRPRGSMGKAKGGARKATAKRAAARRPATRSRRSR